MEWEYACLAETVTSRFFGQSDELREKDAWQVKGVSERTWPVGCLKPNDWGLFDMYAQLWEFCQEKFGGYSLGRGGKPAEDSEDTRPVRNRESRVIRGGSFTNAATYFRSVRRGNALPPFGYKHVGFRPARTLR